MLTPNFAKLAVVSVAANLSDQMMLALLPLVLVAAGASAGTVSTVVAAHAAAWLLVSLPVGAYADVVSRRTIMLLGSGAILGASALGALALYAEAAPPWLLAMTAFGIASGVVMLLLSVFAMMPKTVAGARLAAANASLEFGRAVVSIAAPVVAAALVTRQAAAAGFVVAFLGGLAALSAAAASPGEATTPGAGPALVQSIKDGAAFVAEQPILRAIAVCAIAWNSAFFALTAVFATFATEELGLSIGEVGQMWSVYGLGLLFGSLLAAPMIARLPTGFMFLLGPAASVVAAVLLAGVARRGETWPVAVAFFALGFGPMTWNVLQTSVRQIVTPGPLLGRVGATVSTAIYGIRPVGALLAGLIAAVAGARWAVWTAAALFAVSWVVLLLTPAVRLKVVPRTP